MWDELIPSDPYLRTTHLIYLCLGAFITLFGLVSLIIKERLFMSEAMVAILIGVLIGPVVGKVIDPSSLFGSSLHSISLEFSRIIIGIQCMACGVDLPGNYVFREWISIAILLGPVMISMWLISALGVYVIFGLGVWDCLIIAACMTPTDPVLANSIVKGKFAEMHIPLNVRLILSAESGANDGLGTPFLFLAVYLLRHPNEPAYAVGQWTYKVLIYQVLLAVVIGTVVAYLAQIALKTAVRREFIDKESILSFSIALAVNANVDLLPLYVSLITIVQLFIEGLASLIGSDDILASFVAGNVLTWDLWFNQKVSSTQFQEVIDALLNLTFFVFVGATAPWSSFNAAEHGLEIWKLLLFALWMLTLRRVPIVLALQRWIPALKNQREAFFAGWFGPIGAGAIFYAHLAVVYLEYPEEKILPIVYFIVVSSVLVHGGSVALFNLSLTRTQTSVYANWENMRQQPDNGVEGGMQLHQANSLEFRKSVDNEGSSIIDVLVNAPATMKAALVRLKDANQTLAEADAACQGEGSRSRKGSIASASESVPTIPEERKPMDREIAFGSLPHRSVASLPKADASAPKADASSKLEEGVEQKSLPQV
ncbi:Sodium/hydrogen exchanger family-domain-containing protein [Chytriomyces cf. hyalinus JEL632]|nr:Sodium/hydrogen exchanger family-domain-containing protein [Chytriomyces cf. hyalinus JEL632]